MQAASGHPPGSLMSHFAFMRDESYFYFTLRSIRERLDNIRLRIEHEAPRELTLSSLQRGAKYKLIPKREPQRNIEQDALLMLPSDIVTASSYRRSHAELSQYLPIEVEYLRTRRNHFYENLMWGFVGGLAASSILTFPFKSVRGAKPFVLFVVASVSAMYWARRGQLLDDAKIMNSHPATTRFFRKLAHE